MEYKSNKTEHFKKLLENPDEETLALIVSLESYARLLVHGYDLMEDFDAKAYVGLARTVKKLQMMYEERFNDRK